jgi:hypothetical protein
VILSWVGSTPMSLRQSLAPRLYNRAMHRRQAIRVATVVLGIAAAVAICLMLLGAAVRAPRAWASEPPDVSLVTRVLHDVRVRSGQSAKVVFRVDAEPPGSGEATVTASLDVQTPRGDVVRVLVPDRRTLPGVALVWRGRLRLPAGSYLLVAHARDAEGRPEVRAEPAHLRVLRPLAAVVPSGRGLRRAFAWAATRAGRVSVAVVDSRGNLHGLRPRQPFVSASVVKAMLLVAYLRSHPAPSASMRGVLRRMIEFSDNAAADVVYGVVGRRGLLTLAHRAGMRDFRPWGGWITTRITAADMAVFFRDMERYIPGRARRFANGLLAGVTPSQSWGIPAAARPLGYRVFFKGGWLGAWVLANQAARVERGGVRLGLAVFTDGNPGSQYGLDTIRGVTARLLGR